MNSKRSILFGLLLLHTHATYAASFQHREEARMWINHQNFAAAPVYRSLLLAQNDLEQPYEEDDWLLHFEEYIADGGKFTITAALPEEEGNFSSSLLNYLQLARNQYYYRPKTPTDYLNNPQTILEEHSKSQVHRLLLHHEAWCQSDFIFPDLAGFIQPPGRGLHLSLPLSLQLYHHIHRLHLCAELASAALNGLVLIAHPLTHTIAFHSKGMIPLQFTAIFTQYLAYKWSRFSHCPKSLVRYKKSSWDWLNFGIQRTLYTTQLLTLTTPYDTEYIDWGQRFIFGLPLPIEFLTSLRILFLSYHEFAGGVFKWNTTSNHTFLVFQLVYILLEMHNRIYRKDRIFQILREPFQPRFAEYQKAIELVKTALKERYDAIQICREHQLADILGADTMALIIDYMYSKEDQNYYQDQYEKIVKHENAQGIKQAIRTWLSKPSAWCTLGTSILFVTLLIPWLT